jgi:NADH dehydrogenase/NADH:ubiquinone oxidoreductase subunit G
VQAADLEALAGLDLLLIFGHYLSATARPSDLKSALGKVETKALFSSHKSGLDSLADFIIPVPVIAEKKGTLTNLEGRVQAVSASLDFEGDGLPEWKVLLALAKELRVETKYFWPLTSPGAIFRALQEEIPFFR